MIRIFLLSFLFSAATVSAQVAPQGGIRFDFKDDLFRIIKFDVSTSVNNDTMLVVTAYDSAGVINGKIQGAYQFVINGILTELSFSDGIAPLSVALNGSTLLYIKHENTAGKTAHLYYVYSTKSSKSPIHIPLWLIIVIPLALMVILFLFSRWLILLVIVLFVIFFLTNGLDFRTFGGMIADSFRSLF